MHVKKPVANKVNSGGSTMVAPYYDPRVFKKPAGLKKEKVASEGATLKIPIITYHYVEYVQDAGDIIRKRLDINPAVFERELKELNDAEYKTYFVRDIPDILDRKIPYEASKSAILTFDDGYEDFYNDALPLLKKYNIKATFFVVNDFVGRRGFVTPGEIRQIIASGLVEIGAHTLDHVYLKLIPKSVAKKQIEESKKGLESDYGIHIKSFAYPYGAFDQQTIDLVKEASFSAAVTEITGADQSKGNIYYLSRYRAGTFSGNIVKVLQNLQK